MENKTPSQPLSVAAQPALTESDYREGAEMHVQNLLGYKTAPLKDGDETQERYFRPEGTEEWVADGEASEFETNAYHFLVDAHVAIQKLQRTAAPVAVPAEPRQKVRMTVDEDCGAIYVYVRGEIAPKGVKRTETVRDEDPVVNFDYDEHGQLLGIEVLP